MKGIKSKKIPPDHLKETHEMLRQQIKILTEDIEMKINSSKTHKHKPKDHVTEQSGRLNEDLFPVQITNYKTAIGNHKAKLEGFFNLKKVESIEEEIKRKRELLFNVKYENNVLNNIHKTQQNAIKDYRNKFQNKNEQLVLNDKLRALKEEFKYTKDLQINFQERLKKQNEKILMLEDRCQLIRDNIERKKKQTLSVTPSEDV